ncbi:C-type lectin domain family 4 member A-like isoform X2 [Stegastes partitus]|uniref:C-type lectin domain family 4 member A-like n=1 Tax=Stegastes partitus TaxID=144197 RepID=A0A3B5A7X5_9TELE|nr:PREDICTED: C-type lectin domain family 4 member A-like isoform X2 [Stegastes partitus]
MEEEVSYTTVIFKTNESSTLEKPKNLEVIYDEVKAQEQAVHPVRTENKTGSPLCTLPTVVVAGLGMTCVVLVSVIIALGIHFTWEYQENINLKSRNWQLEAEKLALQRRAEELVRERDRLNWTMGVILEHENFPVTTHCPQRVCGPCLKDWVLFQSSCYLFVYQWRGWQGSRDHCKGKNADLVVIESQEEQEFISNRTEGYYEESRGYWIGLKLEDTTDTWTWVDGSNSTVTYWMPQSDTPGLCALSLKRVNPLETWHKASCSIRNRCICETKALIRSH